MSILDTLNNVEKTLSSPTYVEGAILTRENLDGFINRLPLKETPIRDRLPRKTGSGLAASWNVMTTLGVGNSPFTEGWTPTEDATGYVRRSAIYKEFGKTKSITDKMLSAGKTFLEQESEQLEVAIREIIQDEEQFIITGDEWVSALQFDWLKVGITTNVVDDNNNALGFRPDLLNQGIELLMTTYWVRPTAIYTGYGAQRAIDDSLSGDVRVNLNSGNEVSTGLRIKSFASMAGDLPFINTFAIQGDSVTYGGNTVEDIIIACETAQGQSVIYMEDLYGLGKADLAKTGASIKFMVTECTVLVNRAEEFQIQIQNVRVK